MWLGFCRATSVCAKPWKARAGPAAPHGGPRGSSFADLSPARKCISRLAGPGAEGQTDLLLRPCTCLIFSFVCLISKLTVLNYLLLNYAFPLRSLINKPVAYFLNHPFTYSLEENRVYMSKQARPGSLQTPAHNVPCAVPVLLVTVAMVMR